MHGFDVTNLEAVLERIYAQAATENIRITPHAQQEMVEEEITLDEVLQAVAGGHTLENYPEHRRGACCLLNGLTQNSRPPHIVCTTA
jgi:hypothetical protein